MIRAGCRTALGRIHLHPLHRCLVMALLACGYLATAHAQQPFDVSSNVIYNPASQQRLDLYVPAAPAKRTALLFVHGGGFREGSKEQMGLLCALYARTGFVAATIDYRLAPAHPFPAALEDTQQAIRWLRAQATVRGFDARRIILIGYSAGGNLSLMAGLADGSGVAAIISAAGPTDLGELLAQTPLAQLKQDLREYLLTTPAALASPINRVSPGDPAVYLFHGQQDTLVPVAQSVVMAQRLQASGVPVLLRVFPNGGHEILLPNTPQLPNPNYETLVQEMTRFIVAVELQP